MSDDVISPIRKRLLNLYKIGKTVTVEDDDGDFQIWIQRIDPWQETDAIKHSKAVRAPIMALKKDVNHPDREAYYSLMEDWGLADLDAQIELLISPKVQEVQASTEARIAASDKWAKDDYLNALQEAWNDGLSKVYAENTEDEEASRVYAALKEYTDEVNDIVEHEAEEFRLDMKTKDPESIREKVVTLLIDTEADQVQMGEFRKWQVFYACRLTSDHDKLVFSDRKDLDIIDPVLYEQLKEAYLDISFEGLEGKD